MELDRDERFVRVPLLNWIFGGCVCQKLFFFMKVCALLIICKCIIFTPVKQKWAIANYKESSVAKFLYYIYYYDAKILYELLGLLFGYLNEEKDAVAVETTDTLDSLELEMWNQPIAWVVRIFFILWAIRLLRKMSLLQLLIEGMFGRRTCSCSDDWKNEYIRTVTFFGLPVYEHLDKAAFDYLENAPLMPEEFFLDDCFDEKTEDPIETEDEIKAKVARKKKKESSGIAKRKTGSRAENPERY